MTARPLGFLRAAIIGTLVAGASLTAAAPASALTGAQQISFLNAQRAANGLPADIVEIPAWSAGCKLHMDYLAATNKFQHHEDQADPQYTAEGHAAGTSSVLVSAGDAFTASGANAFETAPIHLAQMLSPYLWQSGADRGCLTTLRDTDRVFPAPTTFSYPGDGRTNVPVSEVSFEFPFVPAAAVGLNKPGDLTRSLTTGPSLYFFYATAKPSNGRFFGQGKITAASLTGPSGPLDVRTVDNKTSAPDGSPTPLGSYLAPGGILIPAAPLKKDTTYTASVSFTPDSGEPPVTRTWRFATGATLGPSGGPGTTGPVVTPAPTAPPATDAPGSSGGSAVPVITKVKLKLRSLSFDASAAGSVWITVEKRLARQGKKPARWSKKRSFSAAAVAGTNRLSQTKFGKAKYRVRVRAGSETAKILAEKTITLR